MTQPVTADLAGLRDPNFTETAERILENRYLVKDPQGQLTETPKQLLWRVASAIAEGSRPPSTKCVDHDGIVRREAIAFYDLMAEDRFWPNTPTLMNAGRAGMGLSACFVLPVGDSILEIFQAQMHQAVVQKAGGGTGFSFSRLRPQGDRVGTTNGVSSGPITFMEAFNTCTEVIKQGSTRRGANIAILRVDHPDIHAFITCKDDISKFKNFNISVALTDAFLKAYDEGGEYDIINPSTGAVVRREDAVAMMDKIAEHAWLTGEPGLVFIDEINRNNPVPSQPIEATNPCGEQPLAPYESCNLGSINLLEHLREETAFDVEHGIAPEFDWDKLEATVRTAVRFLDNVITVNYYPVPEIEAATKANRKIGLGVMGWADALYALGIPYDSGAATELATRTMAFINDVAIKASHELALTRGPAPNYEISIWAQDQYAMRNLSVTTIAPTGTISMVAGVSGGVEPNFGLSFWRNQAGMQLLDVNPLFRAKLEALSLWTDDMPQRILDAHGSCQEMTGLPAEVRRVFVTAHDISPDWHVRMQAAFQAHTMAAVSKTVNLPHGATVDDVKDIYRMAWKKKLKGITVYRDGSREEQVFSTTKPADPVGDIRYLANAELKEVPLKYETTRERPPVLAGKTFQWRVGDEKCFVTVNSDAQGVREVFVEVGKVGSDVFSLCQALGMLISGMLKENLGTALIKKKLGGIKAETSWNPGGVIHSIPDAVAKSIELVEYGVNSLDELKTAKFASENGEIIIERIVTKGPACPECTGPMAMLEGCMSCQKCGYSKCS